MIFDPSTARILRPFQGGHSGPAARISRCRRLNAASSSFSRASQAVDAVSLGEAVLLVARLGGYLNRKNDGPPGHQVVWEGYARMSSGAQTLERAATIGDDSALHKLIAQKKND